MRQSSCIKAHTAAQRRHESGKKGGIAMPGLSQCLIINLLAAISCQLVALDRLCIIY